LLLSSLLLAGCQTFTSNAGDNSPTTAADIQTAKPSEDGKPNEKTSAHEHDDKDKSQDNAGEVSGTENSDKPAFKNILNEQLELMRNYERPLDIKTWMDQQLDSLSPDTAAILLANYEEYLLDYQTEYENQFFKNEYQEYFIYEYSGSFDRDEVKVTDSKLQALIDEVYDSGYKIRTTEGMFFPVIDYEYLTKYEKNITDQLSDYLYIMSLESNQPFASDAHVTITWDDLASRINAFESYIKAYPNSIRRPEAEYMLLVYFQAYIFGLDNSPAFDYDTNKMDEELKESYQNSLQAYSGTQLAEILGEYTKLLSENGYALNEAVGIYQSDTIKGLRETLDSKIYRHYGLWIEKEKVDHEKHDLIYPVLNGMEDQALQEKINQILYQSISPLLIDEAEGAEYSTHWNDYEVQRFDDDILSVTFDVSTYMEGAAHPTYFLISTNIDLKTGEELSLEQLFPDGYDHKGVLNEKAQPQLEQLDFELLDDFKGIENNQEFYLTADQLVIFYQPYVYTPHAYGILRLHYDLSDLDTWMQRDGSNT
jgi:hypothetical protein